MAEVCEGTCSLVPRRGLTLILIAIQSRGTRIERLKRSLQFELLLSGEQLIGVVQCKSNLTKWMKRGRKQLTLGTSVSDWRAAVIYDTTLSWRIMIAGRAHCQFCYDIVQRIAGNVMAWAQTRSGIWKMPIARRDMKSFALSTSHLFIFLSISITELSSFVNAIYEWMISVPSKMCYIYFIFMISQWSIRNVIISLANHRSCLRVCLFVNIMRWSLPTVQRQL